MHNYALRLGLCGTVRCEPEWTWRARLTDYDLWFVWAGRGTMQTRSGEVALTPGSVFCLRPHGQYFGTHDPAHPLGVSFMHFSFLSPRGRVIHPKAEDLPPEYCQLDVFSFYESLLRRAVDLAQAGAPAEVMEAEALVQAVLAGMRQCRPGDSRADRQQAETLHAVARRMRQDPAAAYTLDALAAEAGYSTGHFSRMFRHYFRQSPKNFLIRARLDRALQLLRESDLPVKQICRMTGYNGVFFFSRQFRQYFGVSPSQWRNHRGEFKR